MSFGPKGHVNDSPWRLSHSASATPGQSSTPRPSQSCRAHYLAANKVKKDGRQLRDGILINHGGKVPSRNVEGAGCIVHPSIIHLVDSHEILSPRLAILRLRPLHQKALLPSTAILQQQQLITRNLMHSMRIWRR
ncbi:unnamed protein product [Strongylus vulgaris]|uniref:Uncharacterized protein n=1 Tax=Strongylus vulgaris TaxID=40348 RepID=A0A3P7IIY0_STRVU|nr:unnamed protein product [Strongylus vulgaris]